MSRVAVITDSTACIPPGLAAQLEIEVVPVHLVVGGRTFADSMTADTGEFYALLERSGERPTTAAPSPGMFLQSLQRALLRADAALVITVSAQFSAMYDSARHAIELAKAEAPQADLRLLDSRNAAMAQGFVVLEAARSAARGAAIDEVLGVAGSMTPRVRLLAMLDTLSYLARSGRVPRVAAWAAGMLQVKPIVRFYASDIRLASRTRTRTRALDQMLTLLEQDAAGRALHLAVHHAHAPEDAERLLAEARGRCEIVESYVTEFTQVMGVHTGPGLVGCAWWPEQ